ncbi:NAD(P)-dependent oxidoreductase [Bordetella holmesii]|uniref:Phosphogluconate dehydrogenase (Decarboxylating), NAD binding domain protein n=2 Tax=Bordetella holmesii TaxID=35814 RepID=A0A158M2N1_9BORD|nr:NAD(P)-dependent oxidoreductase [Bordetella holmesii]AHV94275.1 NAD binding domain of 6-phosphogluconate dehydrogenase family protein [Bordetella holmesii ATCC 51541]AIT26848.1 NAD binding domain of 6-phosphogluconate dehydrogenase family protein [Bordetella holmesii 44057]EWM41585.1 NAD binding domain of 6-phosphogluconate dehydrogenase family protein [Bordetella holmesii 41130]EWM47435.1 NAD binding domain of 6-phosphogluconate dehydrogenase family protein [Bordetella holmesii 35009]EWM51
MIRKLGFVGLGMMGLPMLENLARDDRWEILAFDNAPSPFERLARHPAWGTRLHRAAKLEDLADCHAVITMLPNSPITNSVVLGSQAQAGLIDILQPGALLIDMGSSNPADTLRLSEALVARSLTLLDAPVSGAVAKAANGSLAIMAGGRAEDLERARPVLGSMGTTIIPTGKVASAHAMKALNNYVYAAGLLAASEALAIAQRMDLDPTILTEVLNASSGRNVATETKLKQFIIPQTYNGGFALALMAKDLDTAQSLQTLAGLNARQLSLCANVWKAAQAHLPAGSDNTAIHRYLDQGCPGA